jgi:hypothetical protein
MGRRLSSNALAELLTGKTPEAMFDALYAGRYLSQAGQDAPPEVLALIKTFVRSSRPRPLVPVTLYQRLAVALTESDFLNDSGQRLASQVVSEE